MLFHFFVMFIGFIIIVFVAKNNYGGVEFLSANLPTEHLSITGGTSITFLTVWFLIALWTFTDPGFHQRCYSARSGKVAKWGIVVSVFFWFIFDFLTNTTGLYSKAILPNLENPVLAFPSLAENILSPGFKGVFFAALIATILSTLNSFVFLSATTFSRDFIFRLNINANNTKPKSLIKFTQIGIMVTLILSIVIAYYFQSVVELWYTIGSICIPGLILIVVSSYYSKLQINSNWAIIEILSGVSASLGWLFIRGYFHDTNLLNQLEPMIIGLLVASVIHIFGILKKA
ncbi:MAG: hypothetical protein H6613_19900 [Ignavibacteriales bacterium]|nr:hypothetical protein [Ignavibacteriales bacterium]